MRIVADTNVVISGLLWRGSPRKVLDAARDGIVEIYTCPELVEELRGVLARPRLRLMLDRAAVTVEELIDGYIALSNVIVANRLPEPVTRDPDDDIVIACAVTSDCEYIVSGDDDLLSLRSFREILIVSAADFLAQISMDR